MYNVQLLEIGTLSKVHQSVKQVVCIGPGGQRGKLKPYVADIAINICSHDLLQQWNTQINISPVSNANHIQPLDSRQKYSKVL